MGGREEVLQNVCVEGKKLFCVANVVVERKGE